MKRLALLATTILAMIALTATAANAQEPASVIDTATNESCAENANGYCLVEDVQGTIAFLAPPNHSATCYYDGDLKVWGDGSAYLADSATGMPGTSCDVKSACEGSQPDGWPAQVFSDGSDSQFTGAMEICLESYSLIEHYFLFEPIQIAESAGGTLTIDGQTPYGSQTIDLDLASGNGSSIDIQQAQ